ncbi:g10227 [Coccomyxa elongata]
METLSSKCSCSGREFGSKATCYLTVCRRGRRASRILRTALVAAWRNSAQGQRPLVAVEATSSPLLPPRLPHSTAWLLIGLQAFALVGCLVTGTLARRRRIEVEGLNNRLRQINSELLQRSSVEELVCSADEDREAVLAYRNALENALDAPAAAHPVEGYGPDNMSMAQARRTLSGLLRKGKEALRESDPSEAILAAKQALRIARELMDVRAERAVLRLLARGYRADGKLERSLKALHQSLELSSKLEESSGDVDVLGAIGDLYTDLGDLEKAGEYYDRCIKAIQEDPSSMSSTWDC